MSFLRRYDITLEKGSGKSFRCIDDVLERVPISAVDERDGLTTSLFRKIFFSFLFPIVGVHLAQLVKSFTLVRKRKSRSHWTGFEPAREDPKWFLISRLKPLGHQCLKKLYGKYSCSKIQCYILQNCDLVHIYQ